MCQAVKEYGDKRELKGIREGKLEGESLKATQIVNKLLSEGFELSKALEIAGINMETYELYK